MTADLVPSTRSSRTAQWYRRDADDFTPVARLLVAYLRTQWRGTLSELAEQIDVSQQQVSKYLRRPPDAAIPTPRTLARIAKATGIELATLYRAAGIPTTEEKRR